MCVTNSIRLIEYGIVFIRVLLLELGYLQRVGDNWLISFKNHKTHSKTKRLGRGKTKKICVCR